MNSKPVVATVVNRPSGSFDSTGEDGTAWNAEAAQIKLGTLLNHIYRVDRLIGRGGMGEVYFGTNVNTDEHVAIKIILASLSNDPNVRALFRREARTLTRLSHPALVQYRALAQDPELGVLYIVNEFVDGPSLAAVLSQLKPTSELMIDLLRRLASGLAAAHEIGAVHRDISPDNILLPQARVEFAKIIDFGIAKDLHAASRGQGTSTIIGTGFAGKFGYVAPEQFGDSNQIGPWTDVYSLGLVILSVASGRLLDMGTTFADAIEKRRTVPDLSVIPPVLHSLVRRMVEPDRSRRFQSMREVLEALDVLDTGARQAPALSRSPAKADVSPPARAKNGIRLPYLIAAGCLIAAVIGAGILWKEWVLPAGKPSVASAPAENLSKPPTHTTMPAPKLIKSQATPVAPPPESAKRTVPVSPPIAQVVEQKPGPASSASAKAHAHHGRRAHAVTGGIRSAIEEELRRQKASGGQPGTPQQ